MLFLTGTAATIVLLIGVPFWMFHGQPVDGFSMTDAMRGRDRKMARRYPAVTPKADRRA